jgi:hypothetical protein
VVLLATGPHVAHLYDASGLGRCGAAEVCAEDRRGFFSALKADGSSVVLYFAAIAVLYVTPVLIGLFWGAPLVAREHEAGTLRLAWTQGVTRRRWLLVKLGLGAAAALAVAGVLSAVVTWWAGPIDRAAALPGGAEDNLPNHFNPVVFGARGLAPLGYALFGFVLGVAVGVLVRRTLPALAVTLAVFVAVQVAVPLAVRPHYATPDRTAVPLVVESRPGLQLSIRDGKLGVRMPVDVPGAWVTKVSLVDADGRAYSGPAPEICEGAAHTAEECFAAINALHLRQAAEYQPADRYRRFQGEEVALYVLLSLLSTGFCVRRITPGAAPASDTPSGPGGWRRSVSVRG